MNGAAAGVTPPPEAEDARMREAGGGHQPDHDADARKKGYSERL